MVVVRALDSVKHLLFKTLQMTNRFLTDEDIFYHKLNLVREISANKVITMK